MMGQWPAWLVGAWARVEPYASKLAVWRGYERDLQSLLVYAIGIAVYTGLVFAFYQNLSRRNAYEFGPRETLWGKILRVAEVSLVFPLMIFLYFAVLAVTLFILAKSQSTYQIMLIAMSVVVGVRVTAFVSENASVDLAKTLPLGLLGVLLVDPSYATFSGTWAHVLDVPSLVPVLARFFLLFIVLEGAMRGVRVLALRIVDRSRRKKRGQRLAVRDAKAEARAPLAGAPVADLHAHPVAAAAPRLALDEADVS